MKWGRRKKTSLPSSPRPSLLSSWILKFKKMGGSNKNGKYVKVIPKRKPRSPSRMMMMMGYSHGGGNNGVKGDGYDGGDDASAFWRLSFKEEERSGDGVPGLRPVWYDSDEEPGAPPSSCKSCGFRFEEGESTQMFDEMVSDIRRRKAKALPSCVRGYESSQQVLVEIEKDLSRLELDKGGEVEEKRISVINCNPRKDVCALEMNSGLNASRFREDPLFSPLSSVKTRDCNLKNYEKQRKSLYVSREVPKKRLNRSNRVRVYSPRTTSRIETCKLRALEDLNKAKLKMMKKKKIKEKRASIEGKNDLEKFAVVKCSFDPPRDFRESMMEMIVERGITRPEELEELLACYLTLNSDVYHDLIIKVFRQVWFELSHTWFGNEYAELHKEKCYYYH